MNRLKIGSHLPCSEVNGPGRRFTIWVQGCPLDCPDCFNKELQNFEGGHEQTIDEIFALIKSTENIEGVSYTGGEPFCQAAALTVLSRRVKKLGLSIFCYTGYTLEQLREEGDSDRLALLEEIDILADGRFEADKPANRPWVGSANQHLHFLSERYKDLEKKFSDKRDESEGTQDKACRLDEFEVVIDENGDLVITGFPEDLL